ncbi:MULTISPECIES: hypothetical protein [unclassified Microbacterium]|uniref:hypothetical protein n=1 Tax=unclassified Microbacterium TaxID=2609290 RepID=UPI00386D6C31
MEHIELMPGVQKQDPTFGTLTLTLAEQPVGGETSWYWEAADGARIDCTGEEQAVLRGMTT